MYQKTSLNKFIRFLIFLCNIIVLNNHHLTVRHSLSLSLYLKALNCIKLLIKAKAPSLLKSSRWLRQSLCSLTSCKGLCGQYCRSCRLSFYLSNFLIIKYTFFWRPIQVSKTLICLNYIHPQIRAAILKKNLVAAEEFLTFI